MVLLDLPFQRIKGRFFQLPLPPIGILKGQRVLVTGGTAGLGLAAAIHFAKLGADVIITSRTESRGVEAKRQIQTAAPGSDVRVMELDMARYSSCVALVSELRKIRQGLGGLDAVILNAGMLTPQFSISPEGWEMTIQVNCLSTTLLGMMLLDLMKSEHANRSCPAHIVFVTSRDHLYPDIRHWKAWSVEEGLLHRFSDPKHWPAPWKLQEPNYANSKLLVTYAIGEICKSALGPDGEPQVFINSVCPGMVRTEIGRAVVDQAWFMKVLVALYMGILGKSTEHGAKHYVNAALRPKEEHGRFWIAWLSHEKYLQKAKRNLFTERAREVQALVWKEIIGELSGKVPELQSHWVESP